MQNLAKNKDEPKVREAVVAAAKGIHALISFIDVYLFTYLLQLLRNHWKEQLKLWNPFPKPQRSMQFNLPNKFLPQFVQKVRLSTTFMLFIAYLPYFAAIKKVDPKYLLQVSKELAGLMSAMVSKTRDELVKDEVMLFSFLSNFSF